MSTSPRTDGTNEYSAENEAPFGDVSAEDLHDLAQEELAELEEMGESVDQLREEIEHLKLERDDLKGQLLRSYADLQNFRRISQQRIQDSRREGIEEVVLALIPSMDNFERTLAALANGATVESALEGVGLINRQLRHSLEQFNLKKMSVVGQEFDPNLHEAIETWNSAEHADGTITHELEPGYQLGDKVVRAAKVRVVRKS